MIKSILSAILICLALIIGGCDWPDRSTTMVNKAIRKVCTTLDERYQLECIGVGESGDKHHYKSISLSFKTLHPVSKDEGRKIVIDTLNELLKELNKPELESYLIPYPFTLANVDINIFVYNPDGTKIYYPEVFIFSYGHGKVGYRTKIPEEKYGYHTTEEESYDDALQIVRSQSE